MCRIDGEAGFMKYAITNCDINGNDCLIYYFDRLIRNLDTAGC